MAPWLGLLTFRPSASSSPAIADGPDAAKQVARTDGKGRAREGVLVLVKYTHRSTPFLTNTGLV